MDLNDYQKRAKGTAVFPGSTALQYLTLQLASESGEVAGKIAKYFRGDYDAEKPGAIVFSDLRQVVTKELGDVLWYVAILADFFGVDLDEVASKNLAKLKDRQDRGVIKGSGDNR